MIRVEAAASSDKGKPAVRRGRKARGLIEAAQLPNGGDTAVALGSAAHPFRPAAPARAGT